MKAHAMSGTPPLPPMSRRPARNSTFLIAIIIAMAIIVGLQYTPYAMFSADKTSLLWGMLTGLVIGGLIFGWVKFHTSD
jgi:archaellum biogenesis protein FlaJ (TadC family)